MSKRIDFALKGKLDCAYCGAMTSWNVEHQRSSRTISPWLLEMTVTGSVTTSDGAAACVELRIPCENCGLYGQVETTIPAIK